MQKSWMWSIILNGWLPNDSNIRVRVAYIDLNKAIPKDDFPLPHINILVKNAARSVTYSFMDGFL